MQDDLVSVVIPSRNEPYLKKTILDILEKATGKIEIIAVLDGYWPEDKDIVSDDRVSYIHNETPVGMRDAINQAVAVGKGRYILKTDAHCMFSAGFDEVLKKDMKPNWVVVPRRYPLDPQKWEIEKRNDDKYPIDYMYLDNALHGQEWRKKNTDPKLKEILIDDIMSSQGSCWFMEKDYFNMLRLLDSDNYGTFFNEFQEIGLKTWLYQGQVKVNKKCWYAHWHKTEGRGYSLGNSEKEKGEKETRKWLTNDAWKAQQRQPLSFLIKKFWPVPTWDKSYADNYEYDYEMMFWRKWLGNKGRGAKRLQQEQLVPYFKELIGDKKKVSILDVGGGAIPMYGWKYPNVEVDYHLTDLLADGFPKIFEELGLKTPIIAEKQDMTHLTYPDDSYDIVHCRNAWDHSTNPYEALKEMIRVCKKGGWVYLWHYAHVAKTHGSGMHNTDIDIKNGRCIIKHKTKTFYIDEVDPRFKVEAIEGKHQVIICKLQK